MKGGMDWKTRLNDEPLNWLLEEENPGVRYLALRDLSDKPRLDPDLIAARHAAHQKGPINAVLEEMQPEGYWVKPGPGYLPTYRSTDWSVTLLAQLGAKAQEDIRIEKACEYVLHHALTKGGHFSLNGMPSGSVDCLQGNLCWALLELDCADPRLEQAFEWMARTVTGDGMAPKEDKSADRRYYAGKCGPVFACGANNGRPCAWGATKVLLAFGKLPDAQRSPLMNAAIQQGVDFLFSTELEKAGWPSGYAEKPSKNWWKFGFPVFYVTDILQVAEALVGLGYGTDPRLANTLERIWQKQDEQGRWALEYDYTGKTWGNFGEKNKANKWVTLRALKVLKAAGN